MADNRITFNIDFKADSTNLNSIKQNLQAIQKTTVKDLINPGQFKDAEAELKKIQDMARAVEQAFEATYNQDLGTANLRKFTEYLQSLGYNMSQVQQGFAVFGSTGQLVTSQIRGGVAGINFELKKAHPLLDRMATTLGNSIRYTFSTKLINSFVGSIQTAYSFAKNLDKSLNNIRIVTGKSSEEMANFAVQANKAAKALGASTLDYTNASLIYYQQGLGDADVQARTDVTVKVANITKQSADEVSEQLTAVWNGYRVTAEEAELYIDKLSAVAANSASDLEELSTAMSKVASGAAAMGVDIDELTAQISTIVSVTRQDAANVGTALKTIYARIGDLAISTDAVDEFGVSLGDVSSKLAIMGVNVLDQKGNLRDLGDIIAEVAGKWGTWTEAQQQAAAVALAGKRQYNNLIALFNNWDMYEGALETSKTSEGTLQKQQDTYMESLEAHLDKLRASGERVYDILFDNEKFNGLLDVFSALVDQVGLFFESIGGGTGVLSFVGTLLFSIFGNKLAGFLTDTANNFKVTLNATAQYKTEVKNLKEQTDSLKKAQEGYNKALEEGTASDSQKRAIQKQAADVETQKRRVQIIRGVRTGRIDSEKGAELIGQNTALQQQEQDYYAARENVLNKLPRLQKQYGLNSKSLGTTSNNDIKTLVESLSKGEDLDNIKIKWDNINKVVEKLNENIEIANNKIENALSIPDSFDRNQFGNILGPQEVEDVARFAENYERLRNEIQDTAVGTDELREKQNQQAQLMQKYSTVLSQHGDYQNLITNAVVQYQKVLETNTTKVRERTDEILKLTGATKKDTNEVNKLYAAYAKNPNTENLEALKNKFRELAKATGVSKDEIENLLGTIEKGKPSVEKLKEEVDDINPAPLSEKIVSVVTAITSIISAVQTLLSLTDIWEDETKSTGEKVLQTFQALLGLIVPLMFAANSLNKAFATTGVTGAVAGTGAVVAGTGAGVASKGFAALAASVWAALAPMLIIVVILGVIVGVVWAICEAVDAYKASQEKAQKALEEANKKLEEQKKILEDVKNAYEDLKTSLEDYDKAQEAIDNLIVGTEEWKNAIKDANQQVLDLLSTYPKLAQYITTDSSGRMTISQEGKEKLLEEQQEQIETAQKNVNIATIVRNQEENKNIKDKLKKESKETLWSENDAAKGAAWGTGAGAIAGTGIGIGAGIGAGALAGAAFGSIIPGIGNIIGAVVGSAIGLIGGAIGAGLGAGLGAAGGAIKDATETNITEEQYDNLIDRLTTEGSDLYNISREDLQEILKTEFNISDKELLEKLSDNLIENAEAINENTAANRLLNRQVMQGYLEDKSEYQESEYKDALIALTASSVDAYKEEAKEYVNEINEVNGKDDGYAQAYAEMLGGEEVGYRAKGDKVYRINEDGTLGGVFEEDVDKMKKALQEDKQRKLAANNFQDRIDELSEREKVLNEKGIQDTNLIRQIFNQATGVGANITELKSSDLQKLEEFYKVEEGQEKTPDQMAAEKIAENIKKQENVIRASMTGISDIVSDETGKTLEKVWFDKDLTLGMQKNVADALNKAFALGGTEAAKTASDFLAQYSGEELEKVINLYNAVNWDTLDANEQFTKAMKEADIEIKNANNAFSSMIEAFRNSLSPMQNLTTNFESLKEKLQEISKITGDLNIGDIISEEDYDLLISYNNALEDNFVLLAEGRKLIKPITDEQKQELTKNLLPDPKELDKFKRAVEYQVKYNEDWYNKGYFADGKFKSMENFTDFVRVYGEDDAGKETLQAAGINYEDYKRNYKIANLKNDDWEGIIETLGLQGYDVNNLTDQQKEDILTQLNTEQSKADTYLREARTRLEKVITDVREGTFDLSKEQLSVNIDAYSQGNFNKLREYAPTDASTENYRNAWVKVHKAYVLDEVESLGLSRDAWQKWAETVKDSFDPKKAGVEDFEEYEETILSHLADAQALDSVDTLYDINREIEELQKNLEDATGQQVIDIQNQLIEKEKERSKELERQKGIRDTALKDLRKQLVETVNVVDAEGNIDRELLAEAYAQGDAATKELIERFQDAEAAADDVNDQLEESRDTIKQIEYEKYTATIELKIDVKNAERDYIDFIKSITEYNKDYGGLGQLIQDELLTYYSGVNGEPGSIQINKEAMALAQAAVDAFKAGKDEYRFMLDGQEHVYSSIAEAEQDLKSYTEAYRNDVLAALQLEEAANQAFTSALDAMNSEFNKQLTKYENIQNLINHNITMLQLLYGEDEYESMDVYYRGLQATYDAQIEIQRQLVAKNKEALDSIEDQTSEAYQHALETYNQSVEKLNSLTEAAVRNTLEQYQNLAKQTFEEAFGFSDFEKMAQSWDNFNAFNDRYLTEFNKNYELGKLENEIDKSLDGLKGNIAAQKQLNNLKNAELTALSTKGKLTQYDIDRANLLYQIELKRIQLQNAQSTATKMKLVRDASGNYTYQFVADEEKVAETQQELADLKNQLGNLDAQRFKDVFADMRETLEQFQQEYIEAMSIGNDAERQEALDDLKNKYKDIFESLGGDWETVNQHIAESENAIEELFGPSSDKIKETFGTLSSEMNDFFTKLSDPKSNFWPGFFDNIDTLGAQLGLAIKETVAKAGKDPESYKADSGEAETDLQDFIKNIDTDITNLVNKINQDFSSVFDDLAERMSNIRDIIKDAVNDINNLPDLSKYAIPDETKRSYSGSSLPREIDDARVRHTPFFSGISDRIKRGVAFAGGMTDNSPNRVVNPVRPDSVYTGLRNVETYNDNSTYNLELPNVYKAEDFVRDLQGLPSLAWQRAGLNNKR